MITFFSIELRNVCLCVLFVLQVLFVIGCCAIFSSGDLVLTWYPFARDCLYYMISLLVLALFFGVISADEIWVWEALILLLLYGGYCYLMMNNQRLYEWIQDRVPTSNTQV